MTGKRCCIGCKRSRPKLVWMALFLWGPCDDCERNNALWLGLSVAQLNRLRARHKYAGKPDHEAAGWRPE